MTTWLPGNRSNFQSLRKENVVREVITQVEWATKTREHLTFLGDKGVEVSTPKCTKSKGTVSTVIKV